MGDPGIPQLRILDDLATRILEHAAEELHPDRTTLEVTGYADGDYRIKAYETVAIELDPERGEEVTERREVRYDRRTEWIRWRRYREAESGLIDEETRDLEPYPDPVALAGE